jgi:alpha-L-fucosidase
MNFTSTISKATRCKGIYIWILIFWCNVCIGQQVTAPAPFGVMPSERLLAWHELEFYGFIHFTINTFTDKEWGFGDESPSLFNPTHFDADQIVLSMKSAGMKAIILTAKHHDGFCLWPTKTTEHNITKSPWKNGKGDVVREISEACRRHGLKFGVYLSPWDRNNEFYGTPAYLTNVFYEQLRELNTQYGPVFENWFDGANGGDGYYGGKRDNRQIDRITYYNLNELWNIVRTTQPNSCILTDLGPDIRWVGNESGLAGEICWPTYTPKGRENIDMPGLGLTRYAEAQFGHRGGKNWMPAECDVSIRPGWFYHESENNKVKTVANLVNLYFKSVGRGASFLLNIPPSKEGIVYKTDSIALAHFGNYLNKLYSINYAKDAKVSASSVRSKQLDFAAKNVIDDDRYSYWATPDNVTTGKITLTFPKPIRFDVIRLRENIKLGVRSDDWEVWVKENDQWKVYAKGTSIGASRLIKGKKVTKAQAIEVRIIKGAASISLSDIGIFNSPELPAEKMPEIVRDSKGFVHIGGGTDSENKRIVFVKNYALTTDLPKKYAGPIVNTDSPKYFEPFLMKESGQISAGFVNEDGSINLISSKIFGIYPDTWQLFKNNYNSLFKDKKRLALDGNPETVWIIAIDSTLNDGLIIDTQKLQTIVGFLYIPDASTANGNITSYACYGSENSKDWYFIKEGEFGNIEVNPRPQRVVFPKDKSHFRYIKLIPKQWVGVGSQVRIADWILL